MCHRIEQQRTQLFAFASRFGTPQLFDRAHAFDGNRDQASNGIERLTRQERTGRSNTPNDSRSQAERHECPFIRAIDTRLAAQAT
ncbi:MAG: hypothetical protein DMG80_10985 [Acidobacteria bacterium]|nr:MAG: hypothetical protein DMG80_10985 [Acidobacteriota bacterium]